MCLKSDHVSMAAHLSNYLSYVREAFFRSSSSSFANSSVRPYKVVWDGMGLTSEYGCKCPNCVASLPFII